MACDTIANLCTQSNIVIGTSIDHKKNFFFSRAPQSHAQTHQKNQKKTRRRDLSSQTLSTMKLPPFLGSLLSSSSASLILFLFFYPFLSPLFYSFFFSSYSQSFFLLFYLFKTTKIFFIFIFRLFWIKDLI